MPVVSQYFDRGKKNLSGSIRNYGEGKNRSML